MSVQQTNTVPAISALPARQIVADLGHMDIKDVIARLKARTATTDTVATKTPTAKTPKVKAVMTPKIKVVKIKVAKTPKVKAVKAVKTPKIKVVKVKVVKAPRQTKLGAAIKTVLSNRDADDKTMMGLIETASNTNTAGAKRYLTFVKKYILPNLV